jgi:PhzF family phenazine biosynthesis protein
MQSVAMEMNLSETAFLVRAGDAWSLRWFTPSVEIDLCGHATLASAHALWTAGIASEETLAFDTRSGRLTARRDADLIELDFPVKPVAEAEPPAELLPSLGINAAKFIGRSAFDYLVELGSEEELRALAPDHARLRTIEVRGVIVTTRSSEYDFVSRFFAPGSGIDEDPVTGSAHCALAPFWSERLGKTEFRAYQASPRGGVLRVRLEGERVKLAGRAVTVLRGELVV